MKKIIAMILAAMMVLSMTAAVAEGGKLAEIQAKGKMTICTDAAWAPFEYIGANGEVAGADIELAKYIAEQLGVDLEIINVAFDSISTYLINNDAKSASSKNKKAKELGIPILTEEAFLKMLEE